MNDFHEFKAAIGHASHRIAFGAVPFTLWLNTFVAPAGIARGLAGHVLVAAGAGAGSTICGTVLGTAAAALGTTVDMLRKTPDQLRPLYTAVGIWAGLAIGAVGGFSCAAGLVDDGLARFEANTAAVVRLAPTRGPSLPPTVNPPARIPR